MIDPQGQSERTALIVADRHVRLADDDPRAVDDEPSGLRVRSLARGLQCVPNYCALMFCEFKDASQSVSSALYATADTALEGPSCKWNLRCGWIFAVPLSPP